MMFLNETRRNQIIAALKDHQMLHHLAARCASYNDNLIALDKILLGIVGRLEERVRRIKTAQILGNKQVWRDQSMSMSCDLLIFGAYREEILERQLPVFLFPRTTRATEETQDRIRREIAARGKLQ